MADPRPFTNVDPATAAAVRRSGCDPHELDMFMEHLLTYIYTLVPRLPFPDNGRLAVHAAPSDGVDRISRLPDELLRNFVARLPAKYGARTAVLSSCWRALWRSTPLVLSDAHLLPDGHGWPPTPATSPSVIAAVSRILEAHPGPFRCVDLVWSHMCRARVARWVQLLAAKGVQDLVLVNRPWPQDVPLPAALFSVTTLTSLYIGLWKLPSTDVLRGASFPHLVELGICSVEMERDAVESLVARSPKLEILNIEGCRVELRLHLVSQSLRCVQICGSAKEDIAVVKAPCLERLILSGRVGRGPFSSRVRIGDAPKLYTLGYLERGQVLEVGETIIMDGIKPSTSTMLTTVKILSLNVRFGVRDDVKMVPTFLRCFPKAERLHIVSKRCDQPAAGNHLTRSFWEESGPIENVASRIHTMSLREFIGDPGEVGFLEFFRTARTLRAAFVIMANPRFTPFSKEEAVGKVRHSFRRMVSQSSYQFMLVL
ncbi:putative F-box protein At1g67390 [Triticum aestivum]|uniref:putative F-box protein At1g67390 n=1 Tax=Triticum aestivum TaxID=4565 RepID=UPI001D025B74|nr:putative F-box protein At1g67390 [Triticum aestivum]